MCQKNSISLFHGSKSGIKGKIAPISRESCDFGKGFYMGTIKQQPLTLVCNFPKSKFYTISLDLTDLKVLEMDIDLEWAMFIAFNRGKMDSIKDTPLYNHYKNLAKEYDLIVGHIANDRMTYVLERFFNGEITDVALFHSLSALKLGKQYVALTQNACDKVTIIAEEKISDEDKKNLKEISAEHRTQGIALAEKMCQRYRREGKYFDEILEEGDLK